MAFRLDFKISNLFDTTSSTFFDEVANYLNSIPQINSVLNIKVDEVSGTKGVCMLHKKNETNVFGLNSLYALRFTKDNYSQLVMNGVNLTLTATGEQPGRFWCNINVAGIAFIINNNEDVAIIMYDSETGHNQYAVTFFAETVNGKFEGVSMGTKGAANSASNVNFSYNSTNTKASALLQLRTSIYDDKALIPFFTDADIFKRLYLAFNAPQETSVIYQLDGKKYIEASKQSNMGIAMLYEG